MSDIVHDLIHVALRHGTPEDIISALKRRVDDPSVIKLPLADGDPVPHERTVDPACSFCGKRGQGGYLAGPEVWICHPCVRLCDEIIRSSDE